MISRRSLIQSILGVCLFPFSLFNRQQRGRKCYVNIEMFFETADGSPIESPPDERITYCVELHRRNSQTSCVPIKEDNLMPNVPVFSSMIDALRYLNMDVGECFVMAIPVKGKRPSGGIRISRTGPPLGF